MFPELETMLKEKRWEDGIALLEPCQESLDIEPLEKLCWCYSRAERYADAIKVSEELIARQPSTAKFHYFKGYQFYAQKNWVAATEAFLKAIELYPDYLIVKYRLAYAYLEIAGKFKQFTRAEFWKAVDQLDGCHAIYEKYDKEHAEKHKRTYADICCLHGKAIMPSPQHLNRAIELLTKATTLKTDVNYQYQLSQAFFVKGDYAAAMDSLPSSSIDIPFYVHELKAQILAEQGQTDDAISVLLRLVKTRRKDYLYQRIATYYLRQNNTTQAERYALLAVQTNNRNYKNYFVCGEVYRSKKQFKTTISFLQQAREKRQIQFGQDCPEAAKMIDLIMEETGNNPTDAVFACLPEKTTIMRIGEIVKYNENKGYGFIEEENSVSYFFHVTQFPKGIPPSVGMKIRFKTEQTEKGWQATNISIR